MSSGHLNDVTALAWMVQPLELPLTRCWHDCVGWPAGHRLIMRPHPHPWTLLKHSISYFLCPSNSPDKEENKVNAVDPHLRPMTAYFSAIFRLWPYFKGDLLYYP